MYRNLARKSGATVLAYDITPKEIECVDSISELSRAETIFLSLPGAPEVRAVCRELLEHARPGQAVVDCSTAPVSLAQELARAFAEALAVARASGAVDGKLLFETLAKGSADSFALRNHGMQALLPESHPERAFPVSYMLKDLAYALEFARDAGLELQGAGTAKRLLQETAALGLGEAYHTALIEAVRRHRAS